MKKVFLSFIVTAVLFSCSPSPEKKAQKIIKGYMKEGLKDPSSYEAISFGQLDSVFSTYINTEEGQRLNSLGGMTGEYYSKVRGFNIKSIMAETSQERKAFMDSVDLYEQKTEETKKLFKENNAKYEGEFAGWCMSHKYRAKNSLGGIDVEEDEFYFDKEITEMISPYGLERR